MKTKIYYNPIKEHSLEIPNNYTTVQKIPESFNAYPWM